MSDQKTEQKHTPGPWVIDEDDLRGDPDSIFSIGIWTTEEEPLMVAHVSAFNVDSEEIDGVQKVSASAPEPSHLLQAKANARLIVAAPELLEALKDCRRALELANATGELAVVDAAIAKATGGQRHD